MWGRRVVHHRRLLNWPRPSGVTASSVDKSNMKPAFVRGMAATRLPPPLLVLPGLAIGMMGHVSGIARAPTDAPVQAAAAIFAAMGLIAVAWPLTLMSQNGTPPEPWKETRRLLVEGPYRFSRNPIYLGFLFLQAGLPLWFGYWLPMALLPLTFVLLDRLVVRKEESYLLARFPEYADYLAVTRRWL